MILLVERAVLVTRTLEAAKVVTIAKLSVTTTQSAAVPTVTVAVATRR